MNEDIEALTTLMDKLEKISEISTQTTSSNDNLMILVQLGQQISNLEHEVEKLKGENAFLRTLLKQQFGYNT